EVPAGLESLKPDAPLLQKLAAYGRAWDVPPPDSRDALENFPYEPLAPECLVPLLDTARSLSGLSCSANLFRKSLIPMKTNAWWIPWPARRLSPSKTSAWPSTLPAAWRLNAAPRTK